MQNEFEKQVQKKLEELNLVPSEPVWQKVEMQIRQKKDRRRIFFWLPVAVLLTGGGLWLALNSDSKTFSDNTKSHIKVSAPVVPSKEITNNTIDRKTPGRQTNAIEHNQPTIVADKEQTPNKTGTYLTRQQTYTSGKKINRSEKTVARKTVSKMGSAISKDQYLPGNVEKPVVTIEKTEGISEQSIGQVNTNTTGYIAPAVKSTDTTVISTKEEERTENRTQKQDSVNQDTLSIKKLALEKPKQKKWNYVIAFNGGFSGSGKLTVFDGFFDGQKSMDFAAAPSGGSSTGGQVYYPPSDVKKGTSFTVQVLAKKELGRRTFFSTGLQYNYYSNSILVGSMVTQNAVFREFTVSRYFSNIAMNNSVAPKQSYRNRYHFLSLPVLLDWQLLKKVPLSFTTELSFQYLVKTNGLVFDYNRQAYFHNEKAFNRMQLFSGIGLNYSFPVNKSLLIIGPQLQYGLSRLEKANVDHHLFSYGLKAQLQLNRK